MRATLASKLVSWVGADIVTIVSAGSGWPSCLRVQGSKGECTVAAHMGSIREGHRLRGNTERRFQNPGQGYPISAPEGQIALVLGVSEDTNPPVIVGLDADRRLGRSARQTIFIPVSQLYRAARDGWAEHVGVTGERIIAFTPQHLPEYIERRRSGDRSELVYDGSDLLLPPSPIITDVVPKIELANAALAERLKRYPEGVHQLSPRQFEQLIGELLTDMRCGRIELTPYTRDGGKDLLAYIDVGFGRLLCLIETKRYRADRPVGIGLVRSLYGVVNDADASHATLVTTSSFTKEALKFESRHQHRLSLRDYNHVTEWIRRYGTQKH